MCVDIGMKAQLFPLDNQTYLTQPMGEEVSHRTVSHGGYAIQRNKDASKNYEMQNGAQSGHVYEIGNLERLVTGVDYPQVHKVCILCEAL